jgi:ketosteroid isomerase-like protein
MTHPNETRLRDLYDRFAQGDLGAFLGGCTEDVLFAVPGYASVSGTYTRDEFIPWIEATIARTDGTFGEDVLDVVANDEHGVVLLVHHFDRAGQHYEYQTAHRVEHRDGKIARWTEHPGSMREFEEAWGKH